VVAVPVADGLAVPLPYGTDVDWLRNIEAAGGCDVVLGGTRHHMTGPVVRPAAEALPELPGRWRLRQRIWRFDHWLWLRRAGTQNG
jgi:hypothetical protein